ncbi:MULTISPECIES: YkvA family protein [Aerococcus]|uniref:DUF1232 domain-containing protein n=1 Tax=Aerococcus sanguinicola TaxID=119206 RepID=A0A5N1GQY6_9LACT|nr:MULTISPECIES: DUF1232 domain-containing protein [Aerococcus]KAA9302461.1 DUF1232 domain-containing protein [Aerococcus sanguinicola]MDK6369836.1 DUF1232 domain-containing protein [Aerococcus sp. UMB9870]MDK6680476.1 DUF1232 domain-containing protein [Aerococcus sp. UMB8608]MDK6687644.1 DUF1232 domain-containing protein [Aerococcus sp. UMB8623]MDK6940246.1 DUF1232 domain-containing protein [Aerococcus sp. UMB8487]
MKKNALTNSKTTLAQFVRALFKKETPTHIKLIMGVAIAYAVIPTDFLPDIFGPIGFADDAVIVSVLTTLAMSLLSKNDEVDQAKADIEEAEKVEG